MVRLRVKEIADGQGITQSKLGRMADVDAKTMGRIFNRPTEPVTTTVLGRIARALQVDVSELIESVPDPE